MVKNKTTIKKEFNYDKFKEIDNKYNGKVPEDLILVIDEEERQGMSSVSFQISKFINKFIKRNKK